MRQGTHVPGGRASRTVVSVRIGADGAVDGADTRLQLPAAAELAALSMLRSIIAGGAIPDDGRDSSPDLPELAARLVAAKYVAIVADGEDGDPSRPSQRAEGLVALAQALNTPTRAALFTLPERRQPERRRVAAHLADRISRSRWSSAAACRCITPTAVHSRTSAAWTRPCWLATGAPSRPRRWLPSRRCPKVIIGPAASEAPGTTRVAIDTGRAGIHEGGTAYRMDDIPLPLAPALDGPRTAAMVLGALEEAVSRSLREVAA